MSWVRRPGTMSAMHNMKHRNMVKQANEFAQRQAKLSDHDWAVNVAYHLGGVVKFFDNRRGVVCERWMMGDEDVTQCIMRLERANLVGRHRDEEMIVCTARKLFAIQQRKLRAKKGKP